MESYHGSIIKNGIEIYLGPGIIQQNVTTSKNVVDDVMTANHDIFFLFPSILKSSFEQNIKNFTFFRKRSKCSSQCIYALIFTISSFYSVEKWVKKLSTTVDKIKPLNQVLNVSSNVEKHYQSHISPVAVCRRKYFFR